MSTRATRLFGVAYIFTLVILPLEFRRAVLLELQYLEAIAQPTRLRIKSFFAELPVLEVIELAVFVVLPWHSLHVTAVRRYRTARLEVLQLSVGARKSIRRVLP